MNKKIISGDIFSDLMWRFISNILAVNINIVYIYIFQLCFENFSSIFVHHYILTCICHSVCSRLQDLDFRNVMNANAQCAKSEDVPSPTNRLSESEGVRGKKQVVSSTAEINVLPVIYQPSNLVQCHVC